MKPLPPRLYKYQPYNVQTLDNLKNRRLWFSKPTRFNDPFDCAINFDIDRMNQNEWKVLYRKAKTAWENDSNIESKNAKKDYFSEDLPNEIFKESYQKGIKEQTRNYLETRIHNGGIACFSEIVSNILMWGHYADGHKGFCLEFDTTYQPFRIATPVKYSLAFPRLNPRDEVTDLIMPLVTTKSSDWAYEKEWRIFHEKGDLDYQLDFKALTAVIFGSAMPNHHKEIISLILQGSPTKLFNSRISEKQFKVEFAQVEYKPFNYEINPQN